MEIANIIGSIGWSQSALICGLVCIFVFRNEIASKIKSIKSVSKNGVLMDQNQEIKSTQDSNNDLLGKNDSVVITEQKNIIKTDLKDRNLDLNDNKTVEILIHQLAITQLKLNFEKIYNTIFGSQINLLKKLNEGVKHKDYIESYCKSIINNYSEMSNWDTKIYLTFLFDNTLIVYDDKKEIYAITNYGYEFLSWLLATGNNEDKNY